MIENFSIFPHIAKMHETAAVLKEFEIKPARVGRPRADPYNRLLSRLYEALVFLLLLGQSRGEHTSRTFYLDESTVTRRRFLQNLAYMCDFEKGGKTCTAIGLQECETCYRLWLASNEENGQTKEFLQKVLLSLQKISEDPEVEEATDKIGALSELCIDFAARRIGKERKCLLRAVRQCMKELSNQGAEEGNSIFYSPFYLPSTNSASARDLESWLSLFLTEQSNLQLCISAYDTRHSVFAKELQLWSARTQQRAGLKERYDSFASVRHFLGRLAHHFRATKQLCEDATHMRYMLLSYEVCNINSIYCRARPPRDQHTNLDGILNRMLGKNHDKRLEIERGLHHLDSIKGIFSQFVNDYDRLDPLVHAEVQVLEHFHNNQLVFARGDRFIACSKPACICCEMYFRYHPARVSIPESHRKVWINWGPPLIHNYSKSNPAAIGQRDILNRMIREISELIASQVLGQAPASHWHPDSKTGISDFPDLRLWTDLRKHQPRTGSSLPVGSFAEQSESSIKLECQRYSPMYEPLRLSDDELDVEDGGVKL